MVAQREVSAWRPRVPGVVEVFHAHFTEYAYPMHVHDAWTLLIVDAGVVRYDLDRHEHGTPEGTVSLLPPHVPHNGSPLTPYGFRKRVLYLDLSRLDETYIGPAVDTPDLPDPVLRRRVGQLHTALAHAGDELEAESRLALIGERLRGHLRPGLTTGDGRDAGGSRDAGDGRSVGGGRGADRPLARRLRELLDERLLEGVTLREAAALVHAHPTHLVRAFSGAYGIPPHQYLMSRRVERARRLLLEGRTPGEVAAETGFYDQSHLTRHFKRLVGVAPGRYRGGVSPRR
ncbi:helix-turn-helix transcriptional regulator [Streptomyces beigongshangae]|uniref:helix-turn-helix transcriptional regulator n=1 Tax=Streptomyces beigongshangae TaxID=2841597 RepID=UPI001C84315F|nr:AraC family transcriptional regulator [Streptomyces sp. REN17]